MPGFALVLAPLLVLISSVEKKVFFVKAASAADIE